jgi:c-di-GMP-binding flagellar brake protein YcgR
MQERMRGSGRVPHSVAITATVDGFPKPVPLTLVDVSEAGCRATGRSVFLVGAKVEFRLPLSGRDAPLVHGTVRRCTPGESSGTLEYGIEFSPLPDEDARTLQNFIAQERGRESSSQAAARIETEFPVECVIGNQKNAFPAIAIDIGRGGMRVACEQQLPEGITIAIRFRLPDDPSGRELTMRGRIVQRKHQFREYHHSVAFLDPDNGSIERIERFMRSQPR